MSDDSSMIGFDPLAWINDDDNQKPVENEPVNEVDSTKSKTEKVDVEIAQESSTINDGNATVEIENTVKRDEMETVEEPIIDSDNEINTEIVLDEIANISKAAIIHEQLSAVINVSEKITINLSQVDVVDTAVLQLLTAFVKSRQIHNLDVELLNATDKYDSAVKLLGLNEELLSK